MTVNAYGRKAKKSKAYRPDTRVLELLEKIWLVLNFGFLLIRQLLCNFRRQGTVGYTCTGKFCQKTGG
jgi:hypothetical protein